MRGQYEMTDDFALENRRLKEVMSLLGMESPTDIQRAAIPEIDSGKHVLVIAPTGIGKTEAAMLPIMEKVLEESPKGIACLYITPLRALNRDLLRRLDEFGKRLGISIGVRHGDTPQSERTRQSKSPPQILITTPETFQILFLGRRLLNALKNVRWVIIDEIHELTEDERGAQLSVGLERLSDVVGEFQRIGLSATVGDPEKIAAFLSGKGREASIVKVSAIKEIDLSVNSPIPEEDEEKLAVRLHTDAKHVACMRRARELIERHSSTLFFVNTRDTAEALGVRYHIWDDELRIGVHHGSLSKDVRIQMEEEFKRERLKALICTSSMELGIDIGSADFTVQFNSPRQVTRLIQRVGRSGHRVGERSVGEIIATDFSEIAESMVICRRALAGALEHIIIRENPLTVLANQIAAMCMTAGSISVDKAYSTLKRAYPFTGLDRGEFDEVIALMGQIRVIASDDTVIRKTRRTMRYFYDNISMIPDEKTYRIREVSTRGIIGTLDESFVISSAEPYSTFVTRGRTWQVIEVRDDEVLVEEVKDISGTPSWVGEEIPVPFEIAQEVGRLRSSSCLYDCASQDARKEFGAFVDRQRESGKRMPGANKILIERGDRLLVMHACFGTKVNETLSKLIGNLISARIGESIGIDSNAYAVVFHTPANIDLKQIEAILLETKPESLEALLRMVLRSSGIFRWQFLHVAKKFGAVERGADHRTVNISKIIDAFEDTILFEECLRKTIFENMDVAQAAEVLRAIQNGEMEIETGGLSPLGIEQIDEQKELMMPKTADRSILMALKKRLMEEQVILHCLKCGSQRKSRIGNLPEKKIKCNVCGGVMLAAVRPYGKGDLKALKIRRPKDDEKMAIRRLHKSANLVMSHGRMALLALVARGVGPDTAARILHRFYRNEDDFMRGILAAEINYAKTKRFWD